MMDVQYMEMLVIVDIPRDVIVSAARNGILLSVAKKPVKIFLTR